MAGDHKCPVCQATFTRPQHVARHMRSHTGDRPYKCQHCGDQFARSDLLSRHVNKCHPGERPLSSTAPARRKGTASASRATTSKQACDQCVQSSLPCDGANPCSKCVHRKCRCTFVKFHRQTAPFGPGHPARPNDPNAVALAAAASSGMALPGVGSLPALSGLPSVPPNYRLSDNFLLAPNAPSALTAGSNPNSMYTNHQFSFPNGQVPGTSGVSNAFGDDYAARYRAQAELLSRAGVLPVNGIRPNDPSFQEAHDGRYAAPYPREVPQTVDFGFSIDGKQMYGRDDDAQYGSLPSSFGSNYGTSNGYPPPSFMLDHRRPSTTESQSTGSLQSSAASSSVHLPLPNIHPDYNSHQRSSSSSSGYSDPHSHDYGGENRQPGAGYPAEGEGGFSSAFGLMSLDDPAVLAGLSQGAPFFDQEGASITGSGTGPWDGVTPRAGGHIEQRNGSEKGMGLQTPSSLRELKDMWKQYMRTPLTGPSLTHNGVEAETSPLRSPKRERGERSLVRVASLPSVKTPGVEGVGWDHHRHNGVQNGNGKQVAGRSLNNPDDLRSYEQAVLARKAPLTLNLVPKRRGTLPQAQPGQLPGEDGRLAQMKQDAANLSRPSSSSSTSSLANAFGERQSDSPSPIPLLHPVAYPHQQAQHGADARPGFKRMPSQTLGPEYAKRTAVAVPPGEATVEDEREESMDGWDVNSGAGQASKSLADGVRLADRGRRMSAPTVRVG
ncbi:hypothetical protein OF83DRAFT_369854 [Amylostereum chailletii]|nr:hypothetical protein OF83DRAFT_369854 [Amylostereum chailletii]